MECRVIAFTKVCSNVDNVLCYHYRGGGGKHRENVHKQKSKYWIKILIKSRSMEANIYTNENKKVSTFKHSYVFKIKSKYF